MFFIDAVRFKKKMIIFRDMFDEKKTKHHWMTQNVFDVLYQQILTHDVFSVTKLCLPRDKLIESFFHLLQDVYEKQEQSSLYEHYQSSKSIEKFFHHIILPRW